MPDTRDAISFLESEIEKTEKKPILNFDEYLRLVEREPRRVLRNIFQLFYDMVKKYVGEGIDEHPGDPESIGFVQYDCSKLFTRGTENPFFADRLFANRFVRQVESLKQGFQQNRMYAYDGPSGCGKSTFLNNLLRTFEAYTNTKDGQMFEMFWEIDEGLFLESEVRKTLIVPCPSHDHPILAIPRAYRADFLKRLLPEGDIKTAILNDKEYEWLLREELCTICKSIFTLSLERLELIGKVLGMVRVRTYRFNRRLGEGISIFNPGDIQVSRVVDGKQIGSVSTNTSIQERLEEIFGPNTVRYVFSPLAKTNNGIYVLMDVKLYNQDRFVELHNVISEGVHKVGDIEEQINSLFFALMNPEDKAVIKEKKMESFEGRIQYNKIPFVLEPSTEVKIYRSIFGGSIDQKFLPRVLENFARVIIASRMNPDCKPLKEWLPDLTKYQRYCDENGLLLRMMVYGGVIPEWLSEEHRKRFTALMRRAIVAEGENEGDHGFSGRDSIRLFGEFFSRYNAESHLISMNNVDHYFKHRIGRDRRDEHIPKNFLASLINSYDYAVLGEVKEAIYFYNKERISADILNYLCAISYDPGTRVLCQYTNQEIEVTIDYLKLIGGRIAGREMMDSDALQFARYIQKRYVAVMHNPIMETDLYQELFASYVRNLKEKVLQPFIKNQNFRGAVKMFGTKDFATFDTRMREHITYMIQNLVGKFGYTEQGAKEICLYVLDKDLAQKFT